LVWTTPTGEEVITEPEGAKFLWPDPTPVAPVCPKPAPRQYVPRPGDGIVCSSPSLLRQMRSGRSEAEAHLAFMLEVHVPKPARRQRKTTIVYAPNDPDEPCPF
jgi:hypothetical protein